jgi:hypothetical protein
VLPVVLPRGGGAAGEEEGSEAAAAALGDGDMGPPATLTRGGPPAVTAAAAAAASPPPGADRMPGLATGDADAGPASPLLPVELMCAKPAPSGVRRTAAAPTATAAGVLPASVNPPMSRTLLSSPAWAARVEPGPRGATGVAGEAALLQQAGRVGRKGVGSEWHGWGEGA